MESNRDIIKLARLQLVIIIIFAIFKAFRQTIIAYDPNPVIKIILYSFPNFAEGIVGVFTLTMIGLVLSRKAKFISKFKEHQIYLIALLIAAAYVLLQEFKIHNLGGVNIYDPYDVLFSILGLTTAYITLLYLKPKAIAT